MNSHDVVSLFTNAPTEKALEVIRKKLVEDKTLIERTHLNVNVHDDPSAFFMSTTYY